MPRELTLKVNGGEHRVWVEPETPLIYVLRNDLGLKSVKLGCGLGQCGACKVLVDGLVIHACQLLVQDVGGREVTTLEGLGTPEHLHPVQQAFIDEDVVQCGFCVSGMIVTAKALLDRNPHPSDAEIRSELSGNLCRCGTYDRVLRAVRRAAGDPRPSPPFELRSAGDQASPEGRSLPRPLVQTPDLDAWVRVNTDGTITLFTGKVELGQDLRTSVAMIGADELDISLDRIRVVTADTAQTPNEGYTVSSMSLETSGNAIRCATAEVRRLALDVAYEELEVPRDRLTIVDGTISDSVTGRSVTYWDLFGGKLFGTRVTGVAQPKRPESYATVGHPTPRLDLVGKVTGAPTFVHDLDLPGMAHGRVVRPPNYAARLASVDVEVIRELPGVLTVVRDGSFLGVVAEREEQAVAAMEALRRSAVWESGAPLSPQESLYESMLQHAEQAFLVVDGTPQVGPVPSLCTPRWGLRRR